MEKKEIRIKKRNLFPTLTAAKLGTKFEAEAAKLGVKEVEETESIRHRWFFCQIKMGVASRNAISFFTDCFFFFDGR